METSKALHGQPKFPWIRSDALRRDSSKKHLEIAREAIVMICEDYSDGLPDSDLRAMDESLQGGIESRL